MSMAAARLFATSIVGRAATVFGLDAVEVKPDRWVLQCYGHPPAVGPMSLAELVFFVLEDFVVREEYEVFGDAIDPGKQPAMAEMLMAALDAEAGDAA